MELKNQERWEEIVKVNSADSYSLCCVRFAEAWANAMETEIAKGASVAECMKSTERKVDRRPEFGITGFMYGAAVSFLAQCWKHGEDLRIAHNTEYGQPDSTGTINPAIMTIGGS